MEDFVFAMFGRRFGEANIALGGSHILPLSNVLLAEFEVFVRRVKKLGK
jgi:hypothetical protein